MARGAGPFDQTLRGTVKGLPLGAFFIAYQWRGAYIWDPIGNLVKQSA